MYVSREPEMDYCVKPRCDYHLNDEAGFIRVNNVSPFPVSNCYAHCMTDDMLHNIMGIKRIWCRIPNSRLPPERKLSDIQLNHINYFLFKFIE